MKDFQPYYAVIFTSEHTDNIEGYLEMANKMEALAKKQKGYLGLDTARTDIGITVSYWERLEDIQNWKRESEHLQAQHKGKTHWYKWYNVKICKVEREYEFWK